MAEQLLHEVSALRTVLAHLLARLSYEDLRAISEDISKDFGPFTPRGMGAQSEVQRDQWAHPYRTAIDGILAQAERLRGQQGSMGQDSPRKDR
jgi:hypothetical protein